MSGRSVRVISLGDPNDVACMDNRVQIVTLEDPSASSRRGQYRSLAGAPARHSSSVTKVFCGPVETIGMPAPPPQGKGSRLDWRLTPEGALEVTVGRPLTREEEEKRARERKEKDAGKDAAKDPKDAAAAKPAEPKTSTADLKKALCDPVSLLANRRLPICFETTLGQETQGLSSVTVVNQQPNNPVVVQPRPAGCPPSGGSSGTSGIEVICNTDGYGGGYQSPVVSRCSGIGGGGGGSFTGVRISASNMSPSPRGGRCEPLLPGPCPSAGGRQVTRITEEDEEPMLRVVRIFPDQGGKSRSKRGASGERQGFTRVVHIQEDCPDYM